MTRAASHPLSAGSARGPERQDQGPLLGMRCTYQGLAEQRFDVHRNGSKPRVRPPASTRAEGLGLRVLLPTAGRGDSRAGAGQNAGT